MSTILIAAAVVVALYAAFVVALVALGHRRQARALARFIPDCAVLFKRLLADERVPRSRKLMLALLAVYLASPIDLVPDFIPLAGQFDDAILVALALRSLIRAAGAEVAAANWPGPRASLDALLRVVRVPGP